MVYLIIGELSPFFSVIANNIDGNRNNVKVLISTNENSNKLWLDDNIKVYYGSSFNENLIKNVIDNNNIKNIIYIPLGLGQIITKKETIVDNAKNELFSITHFLDGLRKSKTYKNLVITYLSSYDVYGINNNENVTNNTNLKPSTELGASLAASEAILHSYSVSYKLNINILRLKSSKAPENINNLLSTIKLIKDEQQSKIHFFHLPDNENYNNNDEYIQNLIKLGYKYVENNDNVDDDRYDNWLNKQISKTFKPAARILVYGSNGWIGKQFIELLKTKNIEYFTSNNKPGIDKDSTISDEITEISPSHVISMIGRTHGPNCNNIDYLEGGPDKLNENVRDNLYAPWILATICQNFNLHFTYLGTGCLFEYNNEHPINGVGYTEDDLPNFIGNKYSVVKGFTDQSIKFFKNTLNVRIRLPINDEKSSRNLLYKIINFKQIIDIPNNITYLPECLPILLDLMLQYRTDTINLVNPGSLTLPKILEIYQNITGEKLNYETINVDVNNSLFKNRAHCYLDTTRLQSLIPGVMNSEAAVIHAIRTLFKE